MSRARDLSKLGNPNVIVADTERVGFGTQVPENAANASSSLISAGIVTATVFYGDGSNLEGVASAGLGTAVDDTKDSIGQNIYFTNQELSINENTTVNAPDTSNIAYTQYQQVTVESGSELIIADGDSFIPDVLGIGTALQASTAGAGNGLFGTLYVDNIENVAGRGGPNFPLGITVAGVSTLSGNVSIGGTLTYEDVTNVDSIGVVTARSGVDITSGGIDVTAGGVTVAAGGIDVTGDSSIAGNLTLPTADAKLRLKDGNNYLQFLDTDKTFKFNNSWGAGEFTFHVNGGERLRIGSSGQIGLSGANYGTSGQVITSQGSGAAPQWATPAGGAWTVLSHDDFSTTPATFTESRGWTNDYVQVKCVFSYLSSTGNAYQQIALRVYTDTSLGQQGTLFTSSDYKRTLLRIAHNSTSITGQTETADRLNFKGATGGNFSHISGELIFPITNDTGTNPNKMKTFTVSYTNDDGLVDGFCRLSNQNTILIVGARLFNNEGTPNNFTEGSAVWYGLKKS